MTQGIVLGLVALVIGPLLALLAVYLITQRLLPSAEQSALNVISKAPMQALFNMKWYAIIAVLIVLATMVFSLYRASRVSILGARRADKSSVGAVNRPLRERFHFDILVVIIALTGYGISAYLGGIGGLLDPQTQVLISSPIALLAPIFLLLAAVLLLLRLFPLLLRLGSNLAARGRGAAPMLALAQMARTPRQSIRMTLLLALAIAFAIFTLVFTASQNQRATDIASYQLGADFGGDIPVIFYGLSFQKATALYHSIPGVTSVTADHDDQGTIPEGTSANAPTFSIQIRAIDPNTFEQTMIWTPQDSSQPLTSLMAQLVGHRAKALSNDAIPAIVDASTWNTLGLHVGSIFSIQSNNVAGNETRYEAIAEIQHIPTVSSRAGGVLVDYTSFSTVQMKDHSISTLPTHIWLRTSDNPAVVAQVRAALSSSKWQLDNVNDRRMLIASLQADPLSISLIGILLLGATAAVLLALIANLLASWLSVRTRLTNFAVLRALGATPNEITRSLTWESSIIYTSGLLLGIFFGALLCVTVIPNLVFTSVPPTGSLSLLNINEFFALQQAIATQLVIPPTLIIAFIVLIVIFIVALILMVRVALWPSLGRMLRLIEDQRVNFITQEEVTLARQIAGGGSTRQSRRSVLPSMATLALWRLRHAGFHLLLLGLGMLTAVTLICIVPLFSEVTSTAGVRDFLNASPANSEIALDTATQGLSTRIVSNLKQQFDPLFQQYLGTYLNQSTQFSLQASGFSITASQPAQRTRAGTSPTGVSLVGIPVEEAGSHITLVQGRLPQATSGAIEILLTPATAQNLHVTVGSLITLKGDLFTNPQDMFGGTVPVGTFALHVVGLFTITQAQTAFWHGQDFQPTSQNQTTSYTFLVPSDALLTALDHLAATFHSDTVFSPQTYQLTWYYHLDGSHITINSLNALISRLNALQANMGVKSEKIQEVIQSGALLTYPYLVRTNISSPSSNSFTLPNALDGYSNRVDVVRIPVTILSLQVICLLLFFVVLMADLLVDRQTDSIAILRSRGASNSQVLGSLVIQSIGLGIIALIVGPLIAIVVISLLSQHFLTGTGQDAVNQVTGQPLQAILGIGWYAVGAAFAATLAMCLLFRRAVSMNVLALRREAARTTHRPLWQRLRFDLIAAVIALVGYGISLYLSTIGNLFDTRTNVLVSTPLTLIAPIFLLIACILLFLRFFPYLLRVGSWFAVRSRGAVTMLTIAQMSRAPRQTVRMTLLLALASAFAIFILVFNASQAQRMLDVASYESGADFSGDIAISSTNMTLANETARYQHIPGVLSATVGYTGSGVSSGTFPTIPIEIRAVDSKTFANTAIWTSQDSTQSLTSLMQQLTAQSNQAGGNDSVPAIADAATMNKLNLHVGSLFTVNVNNLQFDTLSALIIAEVQHIPTVNDSAGSGAGDYSPPGGILIDYTTYAHVYERDALNNGAPNDISLPINHTWLRTQDDPLALAHVRAALNTPSLGLINLYDRRAIIDSLHNDPLTLSLTILLALAAVTALLLAFAGNLLASWMSVRTRLNNFTVLRAIGAASWQITGILTWEQAIVYVASLLLGIIFGALLTVTVMPALIFTGVPTSGILSNVSSGEFYVIQQIIPTQVVVPPLLAIAFIMLIAICIIALIMMARTALQPSISQQLRLNED